MKRLATALTVLVGALGLGASQAAANGVAFGVNDNAGLYEAGTGPFWDTMTGLGLTTNTITLRWDETTPDGLNPTDRVDLAPALAAADRANATVEFDVYPRHASELADPRGPARFASFLTRLATAYPDVTQYVVMNECNQDLFVNPQSRHGRNLSAARCGAFLAAGYDALKAVSPGIFVWGLGLSPRGNRPDRTDHPSTDPIDWLGLLGQWYRTSGRTRPLMDGLDLHPYPIPQSVPFAQGNSLAGGPSYGVATLPSVYQAFYDAFDGTGQPTVGPGGLPVSLNEVGIQTVPQGIGYTGTETAGWGIDGATGTWAYQAAWYKRLIDTAQCDASITNVNIFKLIDQNDLSGWQSGLFELGWVPKMSAGVVSHEIATVKTCPTGPPTLWEPTADAGVLGAVVTDPPPPRLSCRRGFASNRSVCVAVASRGM